MIDSQNWVFIVRSIVFIVEARVYPAEEHGWGMDPKELDQFINLAEKKYPGVKKKSKSAASLFY